MVWVGKYTPLRVMTEIVSSLEGEEPWSLLLSDMLNKIL